MFVNNFSRISRAHITESKSCFNVKSSTYYFHMKMKILADFQICISVPLNGNKKKPIRYEFHKGVKPNQYNGNIVRDIFTLLLFSLLRNNLPQ